MYYINIVKKFGLKNARYKCNPATTHVKLTKDALVVIVNQSLCMSMIGSLLYLTYILIGITLSIGVYVCVSMYVIKQTLK